MKLKPLIKSFIGIEQPPKDFDQKSFTLLNMEINNINIRRASAISVFMIIFEILIIVFNDLKQLSVCAPSNITAIYYLILHALIMFISIISLISIYMVKKSKLSDEMKVKAFDNLIFAIPTLIMICLALISGLDQISVGSISAYIVNTIIVGSFVLQKPPRNIIGFSIPYIVFVSGVINFQTNVELMKSNLLNGTVFFIFVLVISTFFYYNFHNSILRGILLKKANQKLEGLTHIDTLTNLNNRRYLDMILERELNYMKRYKETCVVLMIDIDDFKNINDTYGHPIGDIVLKELAKILKDTIRKSDIPIRWGGEEFMAIMFKSEIKTILPVANRILDNIRQNTFGANQNNNIKVTVSIGICQLKGYTKDDFQKAYEKADKALYIAKKNGKDRVEKL
ncbi:MAG: GGDEF domain-containing protein [Clostridiales bacterium]|nr:GGDEF domain-containing protein [Clostridiales bacterium]